MTRINRTLKGKNQTLGEGGGAINDPIKSDVIYRGYVPCHKTIQVGNYMVYTIQKKKEKEKFLVRKKIGSIEDPIVSCFQVSEG